MSREDEMKELSELYQRIHKDDPAPSNKMEEQADSVMTITKKISMGLIIEGVPPSVLELTLFYIWLKLTTGNHGLSDEILEKWTGNIGAVMEPLISMLRKASKEIKDDGPTLEMRKLGEKLQEMKNMFGALEKDKPPRELIEEYTTLATTTLFNLVQEFFDKKIHPGLVESSFFYHWLRISTINANVEEEFFQKLERNWPDVMGKVGKFVEKLSKSS